MTQSLSRRFYLWWHEWLLSFIVGVVVGLLILLLLHLLVPDWVLRHPVFWSLGFITWLKLYRMADAHEKSGQGLCSKALYMDIIGEESRATDYLIQACLQNNRIAQLLSDMRMGKVCQQMVSWQKSFPF